LTFAFGGQRFDTEAFEDIGAIRHKILPQLISVEGRLSFFLSFFHLETTAKLLISLEGILSLFSKCALKSLNNQADFDSAIRRFDPSRPSQLILLV
jgi:hypothetical protein